MYCGLRPQINGRAPQWVENQINQVQANTNANAWRDWHNLTRLTDQLCETTARSSALLPTGNADPTMLTPATMFTQTSQTQGARLTFTSAQKTLRTIKILAHGINIYNDFNSEFFSDYLPYHYGGYNVVTPEDVGAVMVNFCLYPGTYQPSGHMNISRAREFFFSYTSDFVNEQNPADLLVLAIAINFLNDWEEKYMQKHVLVN